jgi:hypothetical protein
MQWGTESVESIMALDRKPRNSNTDPRDDIERWRKDLARWEAAGSVRSEPAAAIRGWIDAVEKMVADGWQ